MASSRTVRTHPTRRALVAALPLGLMLALAPAHAAPLESANALHTTLARSAGEASASAAVDTSSKKAVNRAYWKTWLPASKVKPGWTGDADRCRRGTNSAKHRKATQRALNFLRDLGGLEGVKVTQRLSRKALAAALIMDANDALSHDPPKSWNCWTAAGAGAAQRSNLHIQWGYPLTVGSVLRSYMDDHGDSNTAVGHRRWLMNPFATTMGSGSTTQANAFHVIGTEDTSRRSPAYVGWPTRGWFPTPLEPDGRWSLTVGNEGADLSRATIGVRKVSSGKAVRVKKHPVQNGYANPTVVWEMRKGFSGRGAYRVTVTGIRTADGAAKRTSYVVRLFEPAKPARG